MGRVKPGDTIAIKNPERHSLVKAGKLILQAPDTISAMVPDSTSLSDLKVLESLSDMGIIEVSEESRLLFHQEHDPLFPELVAEYVTFNAVEAVAYLKLLNDTYRQQLLAYERAHKNRATVLKAFTDAD